MDLLTLKLNASVYAEVNVIGKLSPVRGYHTDTKSVLRSGRVVSRRAGVGIGMAWGRLYHITPLPTPQSAARPGVLIAGTVAQW